MRSLATIALALLLLVGCGGGEGKSAVDILKGTKTPAAGTIGAAIFTQNPDQVEESENPDGTTRVRVAWSDGKLEPFEFDVDTKTGSVTGVNEPAKILLEGE